MELQAYSKCLNCVTTNKLNTIQFKEERMFRNAILFISMISFAAIGFTACSDDDPVSPVPTPTARVMVVHASPDAPGVDLLVDNVVAGSNLTFPNNTPYLEVEAGVRNIKVNVAGTSTTVIGADLSIAANMAYTAFAVNTVSNLEPLIFVDNLATPASGKAHVRFIHLSPNAPAVDITLSDGTVLFNNIAFKGSVDFTPLDAGTYPLQVRVAGTSTVALDLGNITLQAGKIYTVFARGLLGGTGTQALGAAIIVNN